MTQAGEKIWFLHLGEAHEGPFTIQEVAEKLEQGLVNGDSLAWKHPMPDWLPVKSIPELAAISRGGSAVAAAPAGADIGSASPSGVSLNLNATQHTIQKEGAGQTDMLRDQVNQMHSEHSQNSGTAMDIGVGNPQGAAEIQMGEAPAESGLDVGTPSYTADDGSMSLAQRLADQQKAESGMDSLEVSPTEADAASLADAMAMGGTQQQDGSMGTNFDLGGAPAGESLSMDAGGAAPTNEVPAEGPGGAIDLGDSLQAAPLETSPVEQPAAGGPVPTEQTGTGFGEPTPVEEVAAAAAASMGANANIAAPGSSATELANATNPAISQPQPQAQPQSQIQTQSSIQAQAQAAPLGDALDPNARVWVLRTMGGVTGQFTLIELSAQYENGDLAPGFELWRPGLTDFQPGQAVLAANPVPAGMAATAGVAAGASSGGVLPQAPAGADFADEDEDEEDDLDSASAQASGGAAGALGKAKDAFGKLGGLGSKLGGLGSIFKKKAKKDEEDFDEEEDDDEDGAVATPAAGAVGQVTGVGAVMTSAKGATKKVNRSGLGAGASFKNLIVILIVAAVAAGGLSLFFFTDIKIPMPSFLAGIFSPLPDLPDVREADYERLKSAAMQGEGASVAYAISKENIYEPKFYVASNAAEGTSVNFELKGIPGKIVNKIQYTLTAKEPIQATKLAVFGPLSDGSKPMPFGHYNLSITVDGTNAKLEEEIFLGPKGPIFERRMKRFKDRLQKEYDEQLTETRQFVETALATYKQMQEKYGALIKAGRFTPVQQSANWENFILANEPIIAELRSNVEARIQDKDDSKQKFFTFQHQKVLQVLSVIERSLKEIGSRIEKKTLFQIDRQESAIMAEAGRNLDEFLRVSAQWEPFDVLVRNATDGPGWSWKPIADFTPDLVNPYLFPTPDGSTPRVIMPEANPAPNATPPASNAPSGGGAPATTPQNTPATAAPATPAANAGSNPAAAPAATPTSNTPAPNSATPGDAAGIDTNSQSPAATPPAAPKPTATPVPATTPAPENNTPAVEPAPGTQPPPQPQATPPASAPAKDSPEAMAPAKGEPTANPAAAAPNSKKKKTVTDEELKALEELEL